MWTRSVVRPAIFVADDVRMKLTQCAPEIVTFCLPPLGPDSCTFLLGGIEPHKPIIKMVRSRADLSQIVTILFPRRQSSFPIGTSSPGLVQLVLRVSRPPTTCVAARSRSIAGDDRRRFHGRIELAVGVGGRVVELRGIVLAAIFHGEFFEHEEHPPDVTRTRAAQYLVHCYSLPAG
jgi:hypothetical protein